MIDQTRARLAELCDEIAARLLDCIELNLFLSPSAVERPLREIQELSSSIAEIELPPVEYRNLTSPRGFIDGAEITFRPPEAAVVNYHLEDPRKRIGTLEHYTYPDCRERGWERVRYNEGHWQKLILVMRAWSRFFRAENKYPWDHHGITLTDETETIAKLAWDSKGHRISFLDVKPKTCKDVTSSSARRVQRNFNKAMQATLFSMSLADDCFTIVDEHE